MRRNGWLLLSSSPTSDDGDGDGDGLTKMLSSELWSATLHTRQHGVRNSLAVASRFQNSFITITPPLIPTIYRTSHLTSFFKAFTTTSSSTIPVRTSLGAASPRHSCSFAFSPAFPRRPASWKSLSHKCREFSSFTYSSRTRDSFSRARRKQIAHLWRYKSSASNGYKAQKTSVAAGVKTKGPAEATGSKQLLDRLPDLSHRFHRPTKEELLAAATGFWSRMSVRFKWLTIRSARPFNSDDISAFFSWVLVGHLVWILVGTTTFFSLLILAVNTVFAQGTLKMLTSWATIGVLCSCLPQALVEPTQ